MRANRARVWRNCSRVETRKQGRWELLDWARIQAEWAGFSGALTLSDVPWWPPSASQCLSKTPQRPLNTAEVDAQRPCNAPQHRL